MGPVEQRIHDRLVAALKPHRVEITNDSARHAGHAGSPGTGESHFSVLLVADAFEGLGRLERHRLVNQVLAEELAGPVHALSLRCLTPEQDL